MNRQSAFGRWGRHLVAAVLAGVVTWYAFVLHHEVPVLDLFDLAVHEVGHFVLAFAPRMLMFLAGSAAQVLVPLLLAVYFGWVRRDPAGGGFCLAWAGASLWDVSVYVADAPVQALPLIGGGQHDWAYLLGSQGWGVIDQAGAIARFLEACGGIMALAGILLALGGMMRGLRRQTAVVVPTPTPLRPGEPDPWLAAAELPFHHQPAVGE